MAANITTTSLSSILHRRHTKLSPFLKLNSTLEPSNPKHTMTAATRTTTVTKVIPSIIVGGGRVGRALEEMGAGEDLLVKRGESVPVDFPGPILVCTRNDDLDAVLQHTPQSRWSGKL